MLKNAHEEKLDQSEKVDEVIFNKIRERADEIERVNRELTDHINLTEKRLLNEIKSLRNDIGDRVGTREIQVVNTWWFYINRLDIIKKLNAIITYVKWLLTLTFFSIYSILLLLLCRVILI